MIDHSPFTRQGSGKNAVLLIHGIAGSPGHFRELIPAIPETYSIYNILLDGHSGFFKEVKKQATKSKQDVINSYATSPFPIRSSGF